MANTRWAGEVLDILEELYPDAGTMLEFNSKFELLVAVVLSAQSTDDQVNKVTKDLFRQYNTPDDFARLEPIYLEKLIKGAGLYRSKAKNIIRLSQAIRDNYGGQVPGDFNELLKLPGVGRKTANVVLAVGFNKPGLGVDTHVQRVTNRIGLVKTLKPEQTEKILKEIIPIDKWSKAHHLFIFHGRKVCKARKPDCDHCKINELCEKNDL